MDNRYPYTHHGPPVHGSKLMDFLISEYNRRQDRPQESARSAQGLASKREDD